MDTQFSIQMSRDQPNTHGFTKYMGQPSPAPRLESLRARSWIVDAKFPDKDKICSLCWTSEEIQRCRWKCAKKGNVLRKFIFKFVNLIRGEWTNHQYETANKEFAGYFKLRRTWEWESPASAPEGSGGRWRRSDRDRHWLDRFLPMGCINDGEHRGHPGPVEETGSRILVDPKNQTPAAQSHRVPQWTLIA